MRARATGQSLEGGAARKWHGVVVVAACVTHACVDLLSTSSTGTSCWRGIVISESDVHTSQERL